MNQDVFKVDFFCVGVAKAGTTTLHDLLCLHDNISLPVRKETNYFSFGHSGKPAFTGPLDGSSVNEPTIVSMDEYVQDFLYKEGDTLGEVCPSYMLEGSAKNIYEHNPDAKIIILLRDPVGRAISNYQHLVRDGREHLSFEEALKAEPERLRTGWEWFWGLKNNSFYHKSVKEYQDTFGKDNVLILFFEDFVKNQNEHIKQVLEHIGLDPLDANQEELESNKSGVVAKKWKYIHRILLSDGVVNSMLRTIMPTKLRKQLGSLLKRYSTEKGEVSLETREHLSSEFSNDLIELEKIVDGKCAIWLGGSSVS